MKKKLACMLLMSALALSMTACGGKDNNGAASDNQQSTMESTAAGQETGEAGEDDGGEAQAAQVERLGGNLRVLALLLQVLEQAGELLHVFIAQVGELALEQLAQVGG